MNLETALGIADDRRPPRERDAQARATAWPAGGSPFLHRTGDRCPADRRIEGFLNDHFADLRLASPLSLPSESLVLPRHGIARELSIPEGADSYSNRLRHLLPRPQRRAAQPAERPPHHRRGRSTSPRGACRSPATRRPCPRPVFAALFRHAVARRAELCWSSRSPPTGPSRCGPSSRCCSGRSSAPRSPASVAQKTMEIRFFAPGGLVSNLDFVESIFGNAGDPYLPENDAGLDVEHWTGHTGCVILAPHLTQLTKKELGLPHWDEATERQRRDGMCWRDPDERYNDGGAFKLTCRSAAGVIVTLIADNYFGYCKKEVKTQISLRRQPLRQRRGGALRRRPGLRQLQPRLRLRRDATTAATTGRIGRRDPRRPRGRRAAARGPRHRPAASRTWSTSRPTPGPSIAAAPGLVDARRPRGRRSRCRPSRST